MGRRKIARECDKRGLLVCKYNLNCQERYIDECKGGRESWFHSHVNKEERGYKIDPQFSEKDREREKSDNSLDFEEDEMDREDKMRIKFDKDFVGAEKKSKKRRKNKNKKNSKKTKHGEKDDLDDSNLTDDSFDDNLDKDDELDQLFGEEKSKKEKQGKKDKRDTEDKEDKRDKEDEDKEDREEEKVIYKKQIKAKIRPPPSIEPAKKTESEKEKILSKMDCKSKAENKCKDDPDKSSCIWKEQQNCESNALLLVCKAKAKKKCLNLKKKSNRRCEIKYSNSCAYSMLGRKGFLRQCSIISKKSCKSAGCEHTYMEKCRRIVRSLDKTSQQSPSQDIEDEINSLPPSPSSSTTNPPPNSTFTSNSTSPVDQWKENTLKEASCESFAKSHCRLRRNKTICRKKSIKKCERRAIFVACKENYAISKCGKEMDANSKKCRVSETKSCRIQNLGRKGLRRECSIRSKKKCASRRKCRKIYKKKCFNGFDAINPSDKNLKAT